MIFFGAGCVAAMKLAGASFGQWEISIIWCMGVPMAVYLTAAVSGAHLSPAVTIALWLFDSFDRRKVLPYIVAQMLWAFCAAALVYGLYIICFLIMSRHTIWVRGSVESLDLAGIFSTYPNPHISVVAQAFLVEMVITAILLCLILALTDDSIPRGPLAPLLIDILIAVYSRLYRRPENPLLLGSVDCPGGRRLSGGIFGYRALIGPNLPGQLSGEEADDVAVTQRCATRSEYKT